MCEHLKLSCPLNELTLRCVKCPSLPLVVFFALRSSLSAMDIGIPAFSWLVLALYIFFCPSLCLVPSHLKRVSCRQHIYLVLFLTGVCRLFPLRWLWAGMGFSYHFAICPMCSVFPFSLFLPAFRWSICFNQVCVYSICVPLLAH